MAPRPRDRNLTLTGTVGDDPMTSLTGQAGNDTISARAGNDQLKGQGGNDTLNGEAGTDTAHYSGRAADYRVSFASGVWTVRDLRAGSPDGTDTLSGVERLFFAAEPNPALQTRFLAPNQPPAASADSNTAANSVAEGAATGAAVGLTAQAIDPDSDAITYSLTSDSSSGGFRIDAATGVVSVADGTKLDHEAAQSHNVTVTATDRFGAVSSQSFAVAVTNVAPSTPTDSDAATNEVAEGAAAGTYTGLTAASDEPGGPAIAYTLELDTSDGGFEVTSDGRVLVKDGSKLVYSSSTTSHQLTVRASDGTSSTDASFTIGLTDVASGPVTLLSRNAAGEAGNDYSQPIALSADGSTALFLSYASDLVAGDTNNALDAFTVDLASGAVTLLGRNASGEVGNGQSYPVALSADGSTALFHSDASNLVEGDTNNTVDAFAVDLASGAVTLLARNAAGEVGNDGSSPLAISADGSTALFNSFASNLADGDTNSAVDAFAVDVASGAVTLLNRNAAGEVGNGSSSSVAISADGSTALFYSAASNLVEGDTNNTFDAFAVDIASGAVMLLSQNAAGEVGNQGSAAVALSADGSTALFYSGADNLVAGDTNGQTDAFAVDLASGAVTLLNRNAAGEVGNDQSYPVALSADGSTALIWSYASDLVAGDTNNALDAFTVDLASGAVTLLSQNAAGEVGNGQSYPVAMSADGSTALFYSAASNLVEGDTNNTFDAFAVDIASGAVTLLSQNTAGEVGNGQSTPVAISADGNIALFGSDASNLVAGDTNNTFDAFAFDLSQQGTFQVT